MGRSSERSEHARRGLACGTRHGILRMVSGQGPSRERVSPQVAKPTSDVYSHTSLRATTDEKCLYKIIVSSFLFLARSYRLR